MPYGCGDGLYDLLSRSQGWTIIFFEGGSCKNSSTAKTAESKNRISGTTEKIRGRLRPMFDILAQASFHQK